MASRASGLGPTSPGGNTVGASVRLGKLIGGTAEANALLALVVIEIAVQVALRRGAFRKAHGG